MITKKPYYKPLISIPIFLWMLLATHSWVLAEEEKRFTLHVVFTDGKTQAPVSDVEVTVKNLRTNNETTTITGDAGQFTLVLRDESVYSITGVKKNYFLSTTANFSTFGRPSPSTVNLAMSIYKMIEGESYQLEGVEFGVNSAQLNAKTKSVLDELIPIILQNPSIHVEIGCHSDARGNDLHNLELTQERATAISQYLKYIGVPEEQVVAKGYGEQLLLNGCTNGVRCSRAKHEENRRVEIKILAIIHY